MTGSVGTGGASAVAGAPFVVVRCGDGVPLRETANQPPSTA
jgi:hypothetical protein